MVARDGVEPPPPAFSVVKQQALPTTYKSRETAEVLGNTCRPAQLLTRIATLNAVHFHLPLKAETRATAAHALTHPSAGTSTAR